MNETRGEIELRANVDSWVQMLGPVGDLATKIARTPFVPRAMQNNPAAVAAAILTGRELDLGPMTSLRGIDVIDGRPSLSAQLLGARILAAGHRIEWRESTDTRATVTIERADGLSSATATFTISDAKRAGLDTKTNWSKYPRAMLRARALTEAAGMACPDVALGLDTGAPDLPTAPPSSAPTVTVQVAPEARQKAPDSLPDPEPDPEPNPEPGPAQLALAAPPAEPERITDRQQRTLRAILADMQRIAGKRLTTDEQRTIIAQHAGLDPETVESSKHLTLEQADTAIQNLSTARNLMRENLETE